MRVTIAKLTYAPRRLKVKNPESDHNLGRLYRHKAHELFDPTQVKPHIRPNIIFEYRRGGGTTTVERYARRNDEKTLWELSYLCQKP